MTTNDKPVIISDLGGVIYSFSPLFHPKEHEDKFIAALRDCSDREARFHDVLRQYNEGKLDLALEAEKEAVTNGKLPVFINIEAAKALFDNTKKFRIAIVSTSKVETSKIILKIAFQEIGINEKQAEKIVSEFDIYDMSLCGDMKKSSPCGEIIKQYKNIDAIIEDSEKNLNAAIEASVKLGHKTEGFTKMVKL